MPQIEQRRFEPPVEFRVMDTERMTPGWKTSKRWLPLWAAVLLGLPVMGCTAGVVLSALDGSTSFWQLPLFGVFIYLWLTMLFNRTEVEVTVGGAWVRTGPLPSGFERERRIDLSRVLRVLIRIQSGPKGTHEHYACVEEQGGAWIDLLGPYYEIEEAQRFAAQVVRTWAWTQPVTAEWGIRRNQRLVWVVVGWGGAIVLGFVWAFLVDLYRGR
jgi:hypothetical protein